jgi:ABC-type glycerol-3-phosphate transport system substrate-binding protein
MRKFIFITITLIAVNNTLPAQDADGKLTVWSHTDELREMVNNYFKPAYPRMQIQYTQTPSDQFQYKLDPVLASGRGSPDVITLERSFVRKYVESGHLMDLTDIYEANRNKMLAYPVEVGTYNGRVYALSWQATPGAMFYRRSLAKKYLGTDDPAAVQEYFSSPDKFLKTAKILKEESGGKCVIVSSRTDLLIPFLSARSQPWVVNGRLVIDPAVEKYMDICKSLYENRLEGRVGQWSEEWFAGMRGGLRDGNGKALETFSYFLPTWGLHYVLKTNTPGTSGDWAMIPGPVPYFWGGTWIGAWKNTQNPDAAKEFIRYLTTDNGFLTSWAKETGDFVVNTEVVNRIKNNYNEHYLGGQNQYAVFAEIANNINGRLTQKTDEVIEDLFYEEVNNYIEGWKSKEQALADFRRQAANQLGF